MVTDRSEKNRLIRDTAIWCITPNGRVLGEKIRQRLDGSQLFVSASLAESVDTDPHLTLFDSLADELGKHFTRFKGHVFIFSTGIAVRLIAGLIKSKLTDPAVVVMDDRGRYVVSLLSGHIGGANALTRDIAAFVGADPVITTATDANHLPAIDLIARENRLFIETPENIKRINMAFLKKEKIRLDDPLDRLRPLLPEGVLDSDKNKQTKAETILCSHECKDVSRETFILRPRVVSVGIGCNRGTPETDIREFLISIFTKYRLSLNSILRIASVDLKADEPGIIILAGSMNLPLVFYSREELNAVKTILTPSKTVETHIGVKSVCEAAAILSAGNGRLIVPKQKTRDVTLAVALEN